MKTVIGIVGKTNVAKDTIMKYIRKKWGIQDICSYTTRGMRDYETEGVQHHFLTDEEADEKLKTEHILAYTENEKTGVRYFATEEQLLDGYNLYIINPNGIEYLKKNLGDVRLVTIYVELQEDIILARAKERGDDMDITTQRLESERDEFDAYRDSKEWDYLICTDKDRCYVETEVDGIMKLIMQESVDKVQD